MTVAREGPPGVAALIRVVLLLAVVGCSDETAVEPVEAPAPAGVVEVVPPADALELGELVAMLPADRALGRPNHRVTRQILREHLATLGLELRELPFVWEGAPEGSELANLELVFPAAVEGAPVVMLSAHYDSVPRSPGADDNGSGVAVLLALARRFAADPPEGEVRLLWFDAEEAGLVGASAYVRGLTAEERQRFVGLINLDTVGFTVRSPGSQRLPQGVRTVFDPGDKGDFLLVAGNLSSGALTRTVTDALDQQTDADFRVESFGLIPGQGWAIPDIRRSDHAPFWDAGLPAVLLTDTANFRSPHYHRTSDRLETLDLEFLAAVARGLEPAVRDLATP